MRTDKYAVVTGATKGIGRAIAERLLCEGYNVICVYAHDDAAAHQMAVKNSAHKENLFFEKCAVSTYENAGKLAEQVSVLFPTVDVLVCNSGMTCLTSFEEIAPQAWAEVMDTNINAPAFLCQSLLPNMNRERSDIIFIGSILGGYAHARSVSYGVSKAMVEALTCELAKTLAAQNVFVNCIAPGFIDTPWQLGKTAEHRQRIEDKIALHRFGKPEEVAGLCMGLLNSTVSGTVIRIDGGYCYA